MDTFQDGKAVITATKGFFLRLTQGWRIAVITDSKDNLFILIEQLMDNFQDGKAVITDAKGLFLWLNQRMKNSCNYGC